VCNQEEFIFRPESAGQLYVIGISSFLKEEIMQRKRESFAGLGYLVHHFPILCISRKRSLEDSFAIKLVVLIDRGWVPEDD
jgi:hypothetical protein